MAALLKERSMVVVLGAGGEDEDEVTCTLYYRTTANETVRDKYGALMFKVSSIGKLVSAGVGPAFDHRKPERSLTDDDRGGWREALYKFKQAERGDGAHYVSTEDVIFLLRCSTQIKDENTRWATVAAFAGAVSEVARGATSECFQHNASTSASRTRRRPSTARRRHHNNHTLIHVPHTRSQHHYHNKKLTAQNPLYYYIFLCVILYQAYAYQTCYSQLCKMQVTIG